MLLNFIKSEVEKVLGFFVTFIQDLQSDVFGGGMSGKFWDMYKGSSSYDSFDESDADMLVTNLTINFTF